MSTSSKPLRSGKHREHTGRWTPQTFAAYLARAIMKADHENLTRLHLAFPDEVDLVRECPLTKERMQYDA